MQDADIARDFEKPVESEVSSAEEYSCAGKLGAWGFSPTLDRCVEGLIAESCYSVSARWDGIAWIAEVKPMGDVKFDLDRAREALRMLEGQMKFGDWVDRQLREADREALKTLATRVCSAASASLERHGDFRDAVNEMGEYELRNWNHPNAHKRGDLRRVLHYYVSAREQYKDGLNEHAAGSVEDATWFDERIRQFQFAARSYIDTPDAHTEWLTNELSAWLLRPYTDMLSRGATRSFLASSPQFVTGFVAGVGWKEPWCTLVPLSISVLLFLLSVALVIVCYLLLTPTMAYAVAAVCGLVYARSYSRFSKERARLTRLWHRVSHLHNEVKNGIYNAGEVIRSFREIEADTSGLPSIFVSVIALAEAQPAQQSG